MAQAKFRKPPPIASASPITVPDAPANSASPEHDLASSDALTRLDTALRASKAQVIEPLLLQAVADTRAERYREGADFALNALSIDERSAIAWHVLAICREKAGDFTSSLKCYDTAYRLDPTSPDIAYNLGHLAFRMGMKVVAEQLFRHHLALQPGSALGANNLACALRDQSRFNEAIEVVREAIYKEPGLALLWNTLGTILTEQGDMQGAVGFFDEALRLAPDFPKAYYNRANARRSLGDMSGALQDCEAALTEAAASGTLESEIAMMRFARSNMLVAAGDLERGWEAYEARLDPYHADVVHFAIDRPRWTPQCDLTGRSLLVFGEQGLGDEIMFANAVPDLIRALGPEGRLTLAVEPRLVSLFQRSFPSARIGAHASARIDHHTVRLAPFLADHEDIDLWSPMASPLREFRSSVNSFPHRVGYLKAAPGRIGHWASILAKLGDQPKVGLVWKSLKMSAERLRYFTPFQHLAPLLSTPNVRFVNLQYGDCDDELTFARDVLGMEIWTPPELDLKDDLDDVAALAYALDLTIGPANATTNLAGACGAPLWLISTPGSWTQLGTCRYPWYPQAKVFSPAEFNRWEPAIAELATALLAFH